MKKPHPGFTMETATEGDAGMISLLGGVSLEGIQFTTDQVRRLKVFYGFDPNFAEEQVRLAGEDHVAHIQKVKDDNAKAKCSYARKPIPGPFDAEGALKFHKAGDNLGVLRMTQKDGLRVMAYLSRFLEDGQDPVRFVHELCKEAGYDTGATGMREPDDGDEPDDED